MGWAAIPGVAASGLSPYGLTPRYKLRPLRGRVVKWPRAVDVQTCLDACLRRHDDWAILRWFFRKITDFFY